MEETERGRGRIYVGNVGRKKARGRIPHPGFEESVMDAKTTLTRVRSTSTLQHRGRFTLP